MVVCNFSALGGYGSDPALGPVADRSRTEAQRAVLHIALQAACPKYAADGCFPDVPTPELVQPAPPAVGTVLIQWHLHPNGYAKEPESWSTVGSLPASGLTDALVLGLQPVTVYASMLFVVVPVSASEQLASAAPPAATGKKGGAAAAPAQAVTDGSSSGRASLVGECVFSVEAVQDLLARVKSLRHRLESPRLPTDLFGEDAPSPDELARLRVSVERVLSGVGRGRPGEGDSESDDERGGGGTLSRQRSMAAPSSAEGSAVGPPTDLQFLIKLEGMLSLHNGLDVVDAGFSAWLGGLLDIENLNRF